MDSASKIALGLVGAAVVLVVGYVSYREYAYRRLVDPEAIRQALDAAGLPPVESAPSRDEYVIERRIPSFVPSAPVSASRRLDDSQQCIGHTVVDVAGSVYVQRIGSNGKPVPCYGRVALVPLR